MARNRLELRRARRVVLTVAATLLLGPALIYGSPTPKSRPSKTVAPKPAPVTDANVVDRVVAARNTADHNALAAYYTKKASDEAPRIAHYEQLLRAYMQLEGKPSQPLQRQARLLLKGARMSQKHYNLLAEAHRTMGSLLDVRQ